MKLWSLSRQKRLSKVIKNEPNPASTQKFKQNNVPGDLFTIALLTLYVPRKYTWDSCTGAIRLIQNRSRVLLRMSSKLILGIEGALVARAQQASSWSYIPAWTDPKERVNSRIPWGGTPKHRFTGMLLTWAKTLM